MRLNVTDFYTLRKQAAKIIFGQKDKKNISRRVTQ